MNEPTSPICVAALYRFARFDDCPAIQRRLKRACAEAGIKGTLIVAPEGINGTIAGTAAGLEKILADIRSLPGCAELEVKHSNAEAMPFYRMKVRVKREIVTMGEPGLDPLNAAGTAIAPEAWNAFISRPGTIVIDTRNDYEVQVGSFTNAINPGMKSFRDFPAWFRAQRGALTDGGEGHRIAMFCTGGIRCEKATAFLKAEGLEEVFQLEGGILKYLETVPAQDSLWQGECFVFDQRVCLTHGLEAGSHALCRGCRMPVSEADRKSSLYEEGISCPACHADRDERQRAGYKERHRQSLLARQRGGQHVGATFPKSKPGTRREKSAHG